MSRPVFNAVLLGRHIDPVAVDCPLRCLFRPNGTRPTEADHARANRDPESPGLRLHAETVPPLRPWLCAIKECRSRGHQARARKPEPQRIRGQQLSIDAALYGVADTFGTYNKPVGPSRNTALRRSRRPTDRCRSRALRP